MANNWDLMEQLETFLAWIKTTPDKDKYNRVLLDRDFGMKLLSSAICRIETLDNLLEAAIKERDFWIEKASKLEGGK